MGKQTRRLGVILPALLGAAATVWMAAALPALAQTTAVRVDAQYDENLKDQASADQAITPARVIRWMMGLRGQPVRRPPSNTEFQPTVDYQDSRVRVVAAIAYKF